jgi:SAM-dependent methyltransferase
MKTSLLPLLVCRKCGRGFDLVTDAADGAEIDGAEIMEGRLVCPGCAAAFPIVRGVPRFLPPSLAADKQATAAAFGYEWTHYSELTDADRKEFLAWIQPLTPADFKDQIVLDGGCGKGRHIFQAAEFGARTVVGVDLSDAVEAAFGNTRHLPNVHVVQGDLLDLPFARPFTLIYSIGVLHHLPVPKEGFLSLAKHVQPGGRIVTWVYGKEGNAWIEKLVDPVRKGLTSRAPKSVTKALSFPPAVVLFAGLRMLYRPARQRAWLKRTLPYSDYLCSIADYTFAENFWNVFDQLVAPTAFYHAKEEVVDWYQTGGVQQVQIEQHNGNSWRGTGIVQL